MNFFQFLINICEFRYLFLFGLCYVFYFSFLSILCFEFTIIQFLVHLYVAFSGDAKNKYTSYRLCIYPIDRTEENWAHFVRYRLNLSCAFVLSPQTSKISFCNIFYHFLIPWIMVSPFLDILTPDKTFLFSWIVFVWQQLN